MITLKAYAARRGVSAMAVSKAVATGRLNASVVRDHHGNPKIADPDLADVEWSANTRRRVDVQPSSRPAVQPASSSEVAKPATPVAPRRADLPDGVPTYHVSQAVRAAAAARREAAQADLAELELAERQGKLVDADVAHADITAHISMAKARLLGVPIRVAQEAPDVASRIVPIVDRCIREALEELTLGGGE